MGGPPGKPGIPNGGMPGLTAGEPPLPFVAGFGVVDLLFPPDAASSDFLEAGAGVDEAEERPDLGLTGSFLAEAESPFSLGGVLRSPFCNGEDA